MQNEKFKSDNVLYRALVLDFMEEEIENAEQSTEKMKLLVESSGSICIDVSKMEYVEGNIEGNNQ